MKLDAFRCDNCEKEYVGAKAKANIWYVKAAKSNPVTSAGETRHYCQTCIKNRKLKGLIPEGKEVNPHDNTEEK